MNRIPSFLGQHVAALRMLLVLTVITGILYPVAVWGLGQGLFPRQANGSLARGPNGQVIGSTLLCQEFTDARGNPLAQYFQPRPSDAILAGAKDDYGCDPRYSAASNYGMNNPKYIALLKSEQKQISAFDHVPVSAIPPDAIQASGSGLDPDISPANAAIQVNRVAAARHISPGQVQALVAASTSGRQWGFLGEPSVNVLTLNTALDARYPG